MKRSKLLNGVLKPKQALFPSIKTIGDFLNEVKAAGGKNPLIKLFLTVLGKTLLFQPS